MKVKGRKILKRVSILHGGYIINLPVRSYKDLKTQMAINTIRFRKCGRSNLISNKVIWMSVLKALKRVSKIKLLRVKLLEAPISGMKVPETIGTVSQQPSKAFLKDTASIMRWKPNTARKY